MFSIIGSVIGLFTSIGPGMFKQWMTAKQDKADKAHELEMMAQQSQDKRDQEIITQTGQANVAIQTTARTTMNNSSQWVVNLSGTVRPLITYCFFLEFFVLSLLAAFNVIQQGTFSEIWSEEMQVTFSTIISFWFGQRLVSKWTR